MSRRPLEPFPGGWLRHRDKHCVWLVTPEGYPHSHAFDEVGLALSEAFRELGGSAPVVQYRSELAGRAPIVYGANLLPADSARLLPPGSILVNLEQASEGSPWWTPAYLSNLRHLPVLDYSPRNRDRLATMGVPHARVLEIGYADALTRIEHAPDKDIDVLFYGSVNERRARVLDALQAAGLRVERLFGVYGAERDAIVGRAKVVLNVHAYDAKVFEIVRVSYLLANGVCVLTEGEPGDPDLQPFAGALAVARYDELVARCLALVADDRERERLGENALAASRTRRQSDLLRALMPA